MIQILYEFLIDRLGVNMTYEIKKFLLPADYLKQIDSKHDTLEQSIFYMDKMSRKTRWRKYTI